MRINNKHSSIDSKRQICRYIFGSSAFDEYDDLDLYIYIPVDVMILTTTYLPLKKTTACLEAGRSNHDPALVLVYSVWRWI